MSRTRQVFPRETVAHLWAHRAQDSARDASGNFYFTGQALYSYGSHFCIAYILGDECGPALAGRILWNDATYSKTTSKMQSIARQALTRQQRETMLYMPDSIGMGKNVDPQRIERDLAAKKLPGITDLIIGHAVSSIANLRGKRATGPARLSLAFMRRESAIAGASVLRKSRPQVPMPLIDTRPTSSNKAEWAAWIRSFAIHKMRADYAAALKDANAYAERAERNAAECSDGFPYAKHAPGCEWEARNIVSGTFDTAQKALRSIDAARKLYADINGKPGPVSLKKTAARMQDLAAVFKARTDEFTRAETRSRVIYDIREAARTVRALRASIKAGNPGFNRRFADMETLQSRANECGMNHPLYFPLAVRLSRIGAAVTARGALADAQRAYDVAQSYLPQHPRDAVRHGMNVAEKCEFIRRLSIAPAMLAHITPDMARIESAAAALVADAKAAAMAKAADVVRAWLAGESNERPDYMAGTFARIRGDVVETSRGASVPIAHACRLARLYAGLVRRGGQEWRDGAGPLVGYYRVNRIGADGSLVIGCHEFNPTEAARLRELLESCEACQTETAEA